MFFHIAVIFLCIFLWFKNRYNHFKRLGFPYIPAKFPFGSADQLGVTEHSCEFFKREYDNFKNKAPAFGMFFLIKPVLVPTDPELIKDILVRNFEIFHDHGFVYHKKNDPLSGNLFFKAGQEWKDLRAKLSPTFTSGRMKMIFHNILRSSHRMIDYLKSFDENIEGIELKEIYSSFTTEVIADVAFGLETDCLKNPENEFRKMGKAIFQPEMKQMMKEFFMFSFENLAMHLGMSHNPKEVTEFFMKAVRDTLSDRESNNVERNDLFQLLINIKNSAEGMSFDEVAANSFVFFLAAFETSSSVITFCTYELALNQDIQKRLRSEISEVLAKHDGEVTYEAIMEMKYLDMVFNETLRKYPITDLQHRRATKDFFIPNTDLIIPSGTQIMIPVAGLHSDERFWENPEKFNPERFSAENVHKIKPFSYIPFSDGPRGCIGLRFGQMQSKIGLVDLLVNFRFFPCSKTAIPIKFLPSAAFQCPADGMWLKIEKL